MLSLMLVLQLALPLVPNPALTPGAMLEATTKDVCTSGWATAHRNVPQSRKREVFKRYGLKPNGVTFEVDHLVSLQLGGSNAIENLWPQSHLTRPWNAKKKDALENRLHWMVCHHQLPLSVAQDALRADWREAYRKFMR